MTIDTWLKENVLQLKHGGIETARLDCLVLLSDEIGRDKSWVLAHPEHELQIEQVNLLSTKITQRTKHTPLAYIRGTSEFYGREFTVNEHVLVPRPESESMIELLIMLRIDQARLTIYDIGTGSGILAITAKLELPSASVFATDTDEYCLRVAQDNATRHGANVTFFRGDLLQPIHQSTIDDRQSVMLANLPYVPLDYPINQAAAHEPASALYSGIDGLDHYRSLFAGLEALPTPPAHIITEALLGQHESLAEVAKQHGYALQSTKGLAQQFDKVV